MTQLMVVLPPERHCVQSCCANFAQRFLGTKMTKEEELPTCFPEHDQFSGLIQ